MENLTPELPVSSEPAPPKKGKLWLPILAAVLVIALVVLGLNWTRLTYRYDPQEGLLKGAQAVMTLPEPASLGLLGQGTLGEVPFSFSGTAELDVREGLRVLVRDFTLSSEPADFTLSGFVSAADAALAAPSLTGGDPEWYGVDLTRPIIDQSRDTGGDPEYGWYFSQEDMDKFQTAADTARTALAGVEKLTFSPGEWEKVRDFWAAHELQDEKLEDGGHRTTLTADPAALRELLEGLGLPEDLLLGACTFTYELSPAGALTAAEGAGENFSFRLDLGGDPAHELTPLLDLHYVRGEVDVTLTMSLTVGPGEGVETPAYRNAFTLLPRY